VFSMLEALDGFGISKIFRNDSFLVTVRHHSLLRGCLVNPTRLRGGLPNFNASAPL